MPMRNLPGGLSQGAITLQKLEAAREMLTATKRNLQIVDASLEMLENGRVPVELPDDIQSEHIPAWFGVTDDLDAAPGIQMGAATVLSNYGWGNPKTGMIRVREEMAFVCTSILVALAVTDHENTATVEPSSSDKTRFFEDAAQNVDGIGKRINPYLRLTDGNTGRDLITGITEAVSPVLAGISPANASLDRGRGAIPFSYLSSIRPGLGSNQKNKLFSEFTIPRGGTIKVEVFNLGFPFSDSNRWRRAYVTLLGYQVNGG